MAITQMPEGWELVVGLEVHVELDTASKMFSPAPTDFGGEPNTRVHPVDAGLPGTLPVVNGDAVASAARLGLALHCGIAETCQFHRKNYFYPDLPKGYQVSQYDVPLCHDGHLDLDVEGEQRRVRIERLHMEEDTGKSLHVGGAGRLHGADESLIDLNRAGIPLLEIVSRPDIHDPETAQAYVRELQAIVLALGVSDARMEQGSMRCDANVSVRRPGEPLGTRTEIKNVNSVRSIGRAIAYEAQRQVTEIEGGGEIVMETRHWDESRGVTETLRRKETVTDYRYFPDPDLTEIVCTPEWVDQQRSWVDERPLPSRVRARLGELGVRDEDVAVLQSEHYLPAFDVLVDAGVDPRAAAVVLVNDVHRNETGSADTPSDVEVVSLRGPLSGEATVVARRVAAAVALADQNVVSSNGRTQLVRAIQTGALPASSTDGDATAEDSAAVVKAHAESAGLVQVSDTGELQAIVDHVIADNADTAEAVRGGNTKAIGALVGQVMKASRGKANPKLANELLRASLVD